MSPGQGRWDGRIHVLESRVRGSESVSQSRLASVGPAGDRAERATGAAASDDNSEDKNQRDPQKLS